MPYEAAPHTVRRGYLATVLASIALATAALPLPGHAGDNDLAFPRLRDPSGEDQQDYSYYYVPQLSELNQHVGMILRTGRVRLNSPAPTAVIDHYSAYSCSGTFHVGSDPVPQATTRDVDWAEVTGLHWGHTDAAPSLVIESARSAAVDERPLVLYFSDRGLRFQLHQALAVLMTACHAAAFPRGAGHAAAADSAPGQAPAADGPRVALR